MAIQTRAEAKARFEADSTSEAPGFADYRDWDGIEAWAKTLSGHGVR